MDFKAYIFDLDGTIYLGDKILPGALGTFDSLRSQGKKVLFLSNNPLRTRQDYVVKLSNMGIRITIDEVINSSYVLCQHLKKLDHGAAVFPIGEEALKRDLEDNGFSISSQPGEIRYVIASFDRTFVYEKLIVALEAIKEGAHFIATNPDRTCPFEDGELPDAGAVIGAIEGMTGRKVEWVAGKPSKIMADVIIEHLRVEPEEILMVGDRLETDIALGRYGFRTALVLTGIAKEEDLQHSLWQPDFLFNGIWELGRLLGKEVG
jgi:arabinose operon protein AraL